MSFSDEKQLNFFEEGLFEDGLVDVEIAHIQEQELLREREYDEAVQEKMIELWDDNDYLIDALLDVLWTVRVTSDKTLVKEIDKVLYDKAERILQA